MAWRERLLTFCGPGVLAGITFEQCRRLWAEPGLEFDLARLPRILSITGQSLKNSFWRRVERRRFEPLIEKVEVRPPLFILGHWRSGTTLLHHLVTRDPRFAFPNSYQASFPHTFLATEYLDSKWMPRFIPARWPMDNMRMLLDDPQEDEFALCVLTLKSPCLAWTFPRQRQVFQKYLDFKSAAPGEREVWQAGLVQFLKKVQWKAGPRTLVLKSPPHTARIPLLLELFPAAKFVHIHRNPHAVFQSTCRTYRILHRWHTVQRVRLDEVEEWIISQYREMYEAFFRDRELLPPGHYHELAFEQLEREPVAELRRLYAALELGDFSSVEPQLQEHLKGLQGYRKNEFPKLEPAMRERVYREWKRSFDEWGYAA